MKIADRLLPYVAAAGGQAAFGRVIGASQPMVHKILMGVTPGPELCVAIEMYTNGGLPRPILRPNDWYRIWPELREKYPDLLPANP